MLCGRITKGRKMDLLKIKTPLELFNYIEKNVQYGFVGKNGKIYSDSSSEDFANACISEWRTLSSSDIIKNGYGHCFDQVEIERDWFVKNEYSCKTILEIYLLPHEKEFSVPSHTFLIYKDKNQGWCWFEHADFYNKGIRKFNTQKEAIIEPLLKFQEESKTNGIKGKDSKYLAYFFFDKPPIGLSHMEFLNFIIKNNQKHSLADL